MDKQEIHEYNLPNGLLSFDPKKHRYMFEGEVIPGCTTLVKTLSPTEILMAWAAKMTGEYIEENVADIDHKDPIEVAEMVREAKRSWRKKRDKLADIGTHVHAFIEQYMRHKHWGTESPELPVNEKARRASLGFVEWLNSHDVVIHSLEQKVLNTGRQGTRPYAGTTDCDMTIDGYRTLVDWKTSSRITPEMGAQLGGYDMALEDMAPGVRYDRHMIVRCDRDTGEIEIYHTKTDAEVHLNRYAFLACYRLHDFKNVFAREVQA